jgi:simple sugar transport system permease protein
VSGSFLKGFLSGSILSGTSLLYATLGEVIVQRSGIVNLGLEGVLLIGASVAFATTAETGSPALGIVVAALAGGLFNLIFGFMVIARRANQLASGLTMMFFGIGSSALIGRPYIEKPIGGLPKLSIPLLSDIPWVGTILFRYDALVYLSFPTAILVWWVLFYTRWGLSLRAVGESPTTAFAAGYRPALLRYQALFLGGLLGGVGGAHLSVALTLTWAEHMTAGRGFIAVALVIFSKWHPLRAILGALLFGGSIMLQLQLQARGTQISPFLLNMVPYLLTIAVLLAWGGSRKYSAPASLGRVYQGTE